MTLRRKTILIIFGALIGLLVLLLNVSSFVLLELEDKQIRSRIDASIVLLFRELNFLALESVASADYFNWHPMQDRIKVRHNLQTDIIQPTFTKLNIQATIVIDHENRVIFNYLDQAISSKQFKPLRLLDALQKERLSVYPASISGQVNGFVRLPTHILLLTATPIKATPHSPKRGMLLMGRLFSETEIHQLNRLTGNTIQIKLFQDHAVIHNFIKTHRAILETSHIIQMVDEKKIIGYTLIRDIEQRPAVLLQGQMPRAIYQQGLVGLRYLSFFVLICACLFAALVLWLFERLVLARLAVLSREVMSIYTTGNLSTVTIEGRDELAQLAEAINAMLAALHTSNAQIKKSEISLAEAQRIAHLGNWNWDITDNYFTCSDEIYRIVGLAPHMFTPTYELFLSYIHPDDRRTVTSLINKAIREGRSYRIEHRIIRQDGSERIVHNRGEAITHRAQTVRMIGTLQDITESKQAQAETLRLLEENRFLIHRSTAIQEKERRYLARELHDEFGQCITAIQADIETIIELAKNCTIPNRLKKIIISAQAILNVSTHMYEVVHSLMRQLRPSGLDLGLVEALQDCATTWQTRHPEVRCTFTTSGKLHHLGETVNITLYRIVQECLTNVTKYAQASQVSILLATHPVTQTLLLQIQDNGRGMDPNRHKRGLGLIGMRERVQALEGHWHLESGLGQGVKITISIPIAEEYLQKHRPWKKR